jgi:apolipoprotein N-acyltransferase
MLTSISIPRFDKRGHGAALITVSVLVYAITFLVINRPVSLLVFVAIIPLLAFADRHGPFLSATAGAIAGASILGLVCNWLWGYHPGAILVAMSIGLFWFSLALAIISAVLKTGSRFAIPAAAFIWTAAELGRTTGFLAFNYASLPYALTDSNAAMWLASIGGAPLVGLVIAGANASFYAALKRLRGPQAGRNAGIAIRASFGIACILATAALGAPSAGDGILDADRLIATEHPAGLPAAGSFRVALIQPSVGKLRTVIDYESSFKRISALSTEALQYKPDLVVWHETAVIPAIEWHIRHRPDRPTFELVAKVDTFLSDFPVPVLLGNGYAQPDDVRRTIEHNSALLYSEGKVVDRYDKVMLVPFSEYVPPILRMSAVNDWILSRFGTYWTPGAGAKLLSAGSANFAAPICFEDSFGRYMASFNAPDFLVVLTNDSWARSSAMQDLHLAMSRFRAAETGSYILRVADTGATAAIEPDGRVAGRLAPFDQAMLIVDVPLGKATTTPYERYGKHSDIAILGIGLLLIVMSVASRWFSFRIDNNPGV